MAGFGSNYTALPAAAVRAQATPPAGNSQEAIWHCLYDTNTYTDNTTTRLTFFDAARGDVTLSNMEVAGQLSAPQTFQVHNVCCDAWTASGVSTAAGGLVGNLDDLQLLLVVGRPVWTLNMASKRYGPYPLTALHGTGGPTGFGYGTFTAEESLQFAKNTDSPGWNYYGKIIILEQSSFNMEVQWAAAQNLTADWRIRISMFGVLNRRVQ